MPGTSGSRIGMLVLVSLLAACSARPELLEADLVIRRATLIDGTGSAPRPNTDIFVSEEVITAVRESGEVAVPAGVVVIDTNGAYVVPGLSDMHVHFSLGQPGPRRLGETEEVLKRLLYYGVTSILNLGASDGSTDAIRRLRARQDAGEVPGPTVYGTGGHLTVPGTHPVWTIFPPSLRSAAEAILAETPEDKPADLDPLGLGISLVRTTEAAREAVRERAAGGMHAIKITVESGPSAFGNDHPLMPVAMIRAIVDEASAHGLQVFAHVSSLHELERVMEGGVTGIVHAVSEPPFPGAAVGAEMARLQFHMVATLSLYDAFVRYAEDPERAHDPFLAETMSKDETDRLLRSGVLAEDPSAGSLASQREETDAVMRDVGVLQRLGVPVVLGTDVGNPGVFPGFSAHEELANLVKGGLTPMQAIQSATLNAARMLGREEEFGSIEAGKRADLLILGADPLVDIRNSRSIRAVIVRGRLVDRSALLSVNQDAMTSGLQPPGCGPICR